MGWSRVEAWFYLRLITTVRPVVMSTLRHKPASVHRKKQSIGIHIHFTFYIHLYDYMYLHSRHTHAHTRTHLQWIFCIVGNNKHSSRNSRICINHKLNQTFSFRLLGSSLQFTKSHMTSTAWHIIRLGIYTSKKLVIGLWTTSEKPYLHIPSKQRVHISWENENNRLKQNRGWEFIWIYVSFRKVCFVLNHPKLTCHLISKGFFSNHHFSVALGPRCNSRSHAFQALLPTFGQSFKAIALGETKKNGAFGSFNPHVALLSLGFHHH